MPKCRRRRDRYKESPQPKINATAITPLTGVAQEVVGGDFVNLMLISAFGISAVTITNVGASTLASGTGLQISYPNACPTAYQVSAVINGVNSGATPIVVGIVSGTVNNGTFTSVGTVATTTFVEGTSTPQSLQGVLGIPLGGVIALQNLTPDTVIQINSVRLLITQVTCTPC